MAESSPAAAYRQRLARVAREALEAEIGHRCERGLGSLSRAGRERCVTEATEAELAVVDRERLAAGFPPLDRITGELLLRAVLGSTLGLGPVQEILEDPTVEEILGRWDHVVIHRAGRESEVRRAATGPWRSEQQLVDWLCHVARTQGLTERAFNPGSPLLVMRLGPGLRLAAQREVGERVTFALRRNVLGQVSLAELADRAMFHPVVCDFLTALMRLPETRLIVAGATGAGKTTLARACLTELDRSQHVIVMEDTAELDLFDPELRPNVESWEVREPNAEGNGGVGLAELVRHSLRHRPDWCVVGEVRDGAAATPMLAAMTTGMSSLTTVHARSAVDALDKLQLYLATGPSPIEPSVAQLQLSLAVDFIVHVRRDLATGRRYVAEIAQVAGFDRWRCQTNCIYREHRARRQGAGAFTAEMAERLLAVGFDPARFGSAELAAGAVG